MKKELEGDMAFDGGTIIELVYSTPSGRKALEGIKKEVLRPFATELGLAEAGYILCKKLGEEEASSRMKDLRESNLISVEPIVPVLSNLAARYKCYRSLSLSDCFTLAVGNSRGIPALFARREKELEKEMQKKGFDVTIMFLEDYSISQKAET